MAKSQPPHKKRQTVKFGGKKKKSITPPKLSISQSKSQHINKQQVRVGDKRKKANTPTRLSMAKNSKTSQSWDS